MMGYRMYWCCPFILISCLSVHFLAAQTWDITIVEHPSSLVVPVNETAIFSCTARCTPSQCELMGQWYINDTFGPKHRSHNNLSMSLMLNASKARNSSKVRCYFDLNVIPSSGEDEDSENATLILMDAIPLLPNPLLEINTSHNIITLTWSPPFLWPGRAIRYFNVSFTNKSDNSVTYHRINNKFGNRVFSFMKTIQEEPLMCTEIVVNISAISNYSFSTVKQPLQMFSVTDNILPSAFSFNWSEVVTSNIHFRCDGNDLVDLELSIQLQLPTVACNDRKVNLTFILKNDSDDNNTVMIVGPVLHDSSSVATENISYIVNVNHTYSLVVQVEHESRVIATDTHIVDTFLEYDEYPNSTICSITTTIINESMTPESESPDPDVKDHPDHDGLLDYLLMGGSLTLVLGTIITVITSYYLCYYRKKKREYRFEELRARIQTSLMNNPMYNPMPVYEQISPQYIPQTTETVTYIHATEFEGSTQPDLDASNHQNELSDHIIQNVNISDTTDDSQPVEHNDPTGETSSVSDTADASPMTPSTLHLTVDIGIINNANDGKELGTQEVVSAASETEIKQEDKALYTDDTD